MSHNNSETDSCLSLQSRSVLGSFGVVLMSSKVNFHVVRSALLYPACRIKYIYIAFAVSFRSNCDPVIREKLRNYYSKPAFIPDDAETGDQDWIFMGGPGPGAPIHVSN